VIKAPVRSPRANALAERFVRTVRVECLDWTLVLGRRHLEAVLREYFRHYDEQRPRPRRTDGPDCLSGTSRVRGLTLGMGTPKVVAVMGIYASLAVRRTSRRRDATALATIDHQVGVVVEGSCPLGGSRTCRAVSAPHRRRRLIGLLGSADCPGEGPGGCVGAGLVELRAASCCEERPARVLAQHPSRIAQGEPRLAVFILEEPARQSRVPAGTTHRLP
jgi:hypothetical protein